MSFSVTILANKSNPFGIAKDVNVLRSILAGTPAQVRHVDPLEAPSYSDINIHLEIPAYGWMAWGAKNIFVVNPEWYIETAWNPYMSKMDLIVVKDSLTYDYFLGLFGSEKVRYIPWATRTSFTTTPAQKNAFLWVLGASTSKRAYVPTLLKAWKPEYPELLITTTTKFLAADLSGIEVPANISFRIEDLEADERARLGQEYKGHICCSRAEGFGYTAAEAEAAGAFTILNELPCYKNDYRDVFFVPSKLENKYYDSGADIKAIQGALEAAFADFAKWDSKDRARRQASASSRWQKFSVAWSDLFKAYSGIKRPASLKHLPPVLFQDSAPHISVVTLIYNRKKFFDLACHSLMITDYPKDKIEWILVDDSDDPMEQNSDKIVQVADAAAPLKMVYVPLKKKTSVSEKRNIGCEKATADIILMMDDDDHYPETSLRRRVAWLTKHPWAPKAVAATTIACYDLLKGVSAVNTPPMGLPLSQRISEATLTFYKSWWAERKFSAGILVGEGEEFIFGREADVLEIPPQQIIVAFSHGKNVSSRRIPSGEDLKAGCFWGFPKEFLLFIHGLAGVNVVEN
jgi:Glycosyl transferase family 2